MALFGTTKKKTVKKTTTARSAGEVKDASGRLEGIILAPWLSEKALIGTEKGVYVFKVPGSATKTQVKSAIEKMYKVVPVKVNVVNVPGKKKNLRAKRGFGVRAARSKVYVYLKKGETITFA